MSSFEMPESYGWHAQYFMATVNKKNQFPVASRQHLDHHTTDAGLIKYDCLSAGQRLLQARYGVTCKCEEHCGFGTQAPEWCEIDVCVSVCVYTES